MNCFQIVSLTYWTQQCMQKVYLWRRCELLSDCIFDLLNTATLYRYQHPKSLWIAFRLYLWLIEHSHKSINSTFHYVVNCFQIVSLTYWTQRRTGRGDNLRCCELLSDCIFDLLNTADKFCLELNSELWIAFRLYLWLIEHSERSILFLNYVVVNCFQIVSLTYWTQQRF